MRLFDTGSAALLQFVVQVSHFKSIDQRRQMKWMKTTNLVLLMEVGGSACTAAILVSSRRASALPNLSRWMQLNLPARSRIGL